ncbi:caffeic acid 3-O-methyltransferase-like [Gossypium arboreum]|uniref:caffeic acid 3-O-methyltransferase-like n=1 Tax=Gossypium arboreum TaxID=29729 RepID=UPI0022F15F13|nr:caffeic acid 3-O-methyltransferase-like [Gossypium arboreum]
MPKRSTAAAAGVDVKASTMNWNKRLAMEIIAAVSSAVAVGVYNYRKLKVRMMSSQQSTTKEEEDCLRAIQYATSTVLPFALKAAVDLDLFEIIAKSGPGSMVSAAEIVSRLPAKNPNASEIIDRILRFLTAHSVLDCKVATAEDGNTTRLYGIASIGKYFVQNEDGISVVPMLHLNMDRHVFESWNFLKEATLEGGLSFVRGFRGDLFEAVTKDRNLANNFNHTMSNHTAIVMNKALQIYKGFEGLTQVVDVGGGWGTNLKLIIFKVPSN